MFLSLRGGACTCVLTRAFANCARIVTSMCSRTRSIRRTRKGNMPHSCLSRPKPALDAPRWR